ncbi:MAG TPA: oxygenase MpaB family protein [Streptosporangiaceae bacterium]
MSSLLRKPHKWIDAEVARLDPEQDWAQMYRLMNAYRPNDFMLDLIYAHVFPHFMVPAHGAVPVWRDGDNAKVVNRAGIRADDTSWHNMIWWYYGPDHPETKKSVDTVNKIHAHYAELYPGTFAHHFDYVHVWCFSAVTMHRLRLKMGLPGYTDKEKVAAHRFWKEIGKLFVVPGDDGATHPVDEYPDDFDGVIAWLEEFESRDWPVNDLGAKTSKAVLEQFLHRYFPRPLRPLMRAVIVSFYADSVLKAFRITPPPRPIRFLLRHACGLAMGLGERLGPDPTQSYVERRQQLTAEQRRERSRLLREKGDAFAACFTKSMGLGRDSSGMAMRGGSCPHAVPAPNLPSPDPDVLASETELN